MLRWLPCVLSCALLASCGDPISKVVNERFPPVDIKEQRKSALDSSASALVSLASPNIAVSVGLDELQQAVPAAELAKVGVTKLDIRGDEQLLIVKADFKRTFSAEDAGDNASAKAALGSLRPEVEGSIEVYSGVRGALASNQSPPTLELKLLPGLSVVKVEKVKLGDKVDATVIGKALADVVTRYRDNVTGELTRASFSRYTMPALAPQDIDLAKLLQPKDDPKAPVKVVVSGNPVNPKTQLGGMAFLITDKTVTGLVQIVPIPYTPPGAPPAGEKSFDGLKKRFAAELDEEFGIKEPPSTFIAVRRSLLAETVNHAASQAQLCAAVSLQPPPMHSENKIPTPDPANINCSPNPALNCNATRNCSITAQHDTRNCETCVLRVPFTGHCVQRGNDLFCEGQKKAQNVAYDLDAAARKFDCERIMAGERLLCEGKKTSEKLLCEAGKGIVSAIHQTGNFANLDLDAAVRSDGLNVCLKELRFDSELKTLNFAVDVTGKALVDVNLKFVPLDIMGHLTCQFPLTKARMFGADLRDSSLASTASVVLVADNGQPRVDVTTTEVNVKAKLSPGPTKYLVESPEILIKCPIAGALSPLVISATPFIPELRGEIDHKVGAQSFSSQLPLPEQKFPGVTFELNPIITAKAIGVSAKAKAATK